MPLKPFLRTPFNYDMDLASNETGINCPPEEGRTQQQFAEEVDINTIVRRFGLTGHLPTNPAPPMEGDFTGIVDFHTAMNAVRRAQEGFEAFPAELRARFSNDPQRMLEFLADDTNKDEAVKLGLVNPPAPPIDEPKAPA